jgi:hypothetical protein
MSQSGSDISVDELYGWLVGCLLNPVRMEGSNENAMGQMRDLYARFDSLNLADTFVNALKETSERLSVT